MISKPIEATEVPAFRHWLKRYKGETGPGGIKFSEKVSLKAWPDSGEPWYRRWIVLDFDADSSAPGGFTLVLVSEGLESVLRDVLTTEIERDAWGAA